MNRLLFEAWAERARAAGHPVLSMAPGLLHVVQAPLPVPEMTPNDRLAAARDHARARVAWVHAVMPSAGAALDLGRAIRGPAPAVVVPVRRGGLGSEWSRLVAGQRLGPRAVSDWADGAVRHVVEVPLAWLAFGIDPAPARAGQAVTW